MPPQIEGLWVVLSGSVADGLLYVVIAGLWGAYLLPRWIAHHEELSEARSVERFSRAMRVLSRRGPAPSRQSPVGGRYIVMPRRPAEPEDPDGPRVRRYRSGPVPDSVRRPELRGPEPMTSGRARLAARRRRLLLGLLGLTATLLLVAAVTAVPWWPGALAGVLVVLYVVQLRNQARQAREVARRRAQVQRRSSARQRRTESVGRVAATRQAMLEEQASAEEAARVEEQRRAAQRAVRFEEERCASEAAERAADEAEEETGWRPAPVVLPTYVTKPKAVRPTRTIDLTRPGAWSAGEVGGWESEGWDHDVTRSGTVDAEGEDAEELVVGHELEHRRAVGD